jgi:hypothetical protein
MDSFCLNKHILSLNLMANAATSDWQQETCFDTPQRSFHTARCDNVCDIHALNLKHDTVALRWQNSFLTLFDAGLLFLEVSAWWRTDKDFNISRHNEVCACVCVCVCVCMYGWCVCMYVCMHVYRTPSLSVNSVSAVSHIRRLHINAVLNPSSLSLSVCFIIAGHS